MVKQIQVEILVAPGCASRKPTEELVDRLLAEAALTARVEVVEVTDAKQAMATRFLGSPSVRVNGLDVEPKAGDRREYGLG